MAAKEMTVRACRDGGFVVYDRIQMVQNPEPLAAFGEIRPALDFVLKAMVPAAAGDQVGPLTTMEAQHLREVESAMRVVPRHPLYCGGSQLPDTYLEPRPLPRDEPLMEDDRS